MTTDYRLLQPIQPQLARFCFQATFQQQPITWQVELITLQHYYELCLEEGIYLPEESVSLQQFIEIPQTVTELHPVRIALAIEEVNRANLLKTIIMLSNYKRLQIGRHTYGEKYTFGA